MFATKLVTASSERIYLGVKLQKDVYNQFDCEIRNHFVLELTIYKNSTHFMLLFALVCTPKKCKQKCEYSHYSFALAPVQWLVGRLVRHNFLKRQKVKLPCSHRSTFYLGYRVDGKVLIRINLNFFLLLMKKDTHTFHKWNVRSMLWSLHEK